MGLAGVGPNFRAYRIALLREPDAGGLTNTRHTHAPDPNALRTPDRPIR